MATAKVEQPSSDARATGRPTSSSPSPPVAASTPVIGESSSLTPSPFHGSEQENPLDWLSYFQRYSAFKQLPDNASLSLFALLMRGTANTWFSNLPETDPGSHRLQQGTRTFSYQVCTGSHHALAQGIPPKHYWLRHPSTYPVRSCRTKRYQSFINFALLHYQHE